MRRPRPYTADDRRNTVTALRSLADELDRPDAGRTQQAIGVAMDDTYASTATGSGDTSGGGGNGSGLTVVEAKVARTDPAAAAAVELILRLQRIAHDTPLALDALKGWRGDRPTGLCPEGHTLRPGQARCTWVDETTGRKCGTRRETILHCENPRHRNPSGDPVRMLPGEKRYKAIAVDLPGTPELCECKRCARFRARTGRTWGEVTRLDVPGVNELGCYVSEEPWTGETDA